MKQDTFDYVVAGKWPSGEMNIYSYFNEIQHGTLASAKEMLKYVRDKEGCEEHKIYRVAFHEVVFEEVS